MGLTNLCPHYVGGVAQRQVARAIFQYPYSYTWWLVLTVSWDLKCVENWNSYLWPLHITFLWSYSQQWQLGSKNESPKNEIEKCMPLLPC